nr:hypothetical protein [uncultured Flavobacterium sp.]
MAYQQSNKDNNKVSVGKTIINFNINEFMGNVGLTVENIQNTIYHEYFQHFKADMPGGRNQGHLNILINQKKHSSWNILQKDLKQTLMEL